MAKTGKISSKAKIGLSLVLVITLSAILIALGVYALPGVGGIKGLKAADISGLEYANVNISKDADFSQVFITVRYSDGTSAEIALSELTVENLDIGKVGTQSAKLNFGGYEQVIRFNVVDTECVIEYKATQGGHIEGTTPQKVPAGSDGTQVEAKAEEGYVFTGWNDKYKEAIRKEEKVSKSMELIANFEKIEYKVVFYYDDGTRAREQSVQHGSMPSLIPDPASNLMKIYGKQFIGWDQSYENVTSELHIHPIYKKIATDVILDITKDNRNNVFLGESDLNDEGYYQWNSYANIVVTPRPNRLFTGWSIRTYNGWVELDKVVAQQAIQIYEDGNRISFTSEIASSASGSYRLRFMPEEDLTQVQVRANFAYENSNITFINYSGVVHTANLAYGSPIGPHLPDLPDTEGTMFIGWYLKDSYDAAGNLVKVEENDIFAQDAELVSQYVTKIMTVTFNGTGADNYFELNKTVNVEYLHKFPILEIPGQKPLKEYYDFLGWYLFENGQFTSQVLDGNFTVSSNVELRPKFEIITYSLNITTIGAGTSYDMTSGSLVPLATGTIVIDAATKYTLAFIADTGYSVIGFQSSFSDVIEQKGDPITRVEYTFTPSNHIDIVVEYAVSYYDITVSNGSEWDGGSVTYQNIEGQSVTVTSSETTFIELSFSHGTSKNFLFEAGQSKYVKSIVVNGVEIEGIPRNTLSYSLPIENIDKHTTIEVEYETLEYQVSLPDNQTNYSAMPEVPQEYYPLSSSPKFDVAAQEGYYISALRINGTAINLFVATAGYKTSGLEINYQPQEGNKQDVRVTSFTLEISNIADDKVITIDTAPIYYNVVIDKVGPGDIIKSKPKNTFSYGESLTIIAYTIEGYYVKSMKINGVDTSYQDRDDQQTENFASITQDLHIEYVFSIFSYQVFFNGVGNINASASVAKVGEEAKRFSATFVEHAGSNLNYIITPDVGFYVHSLKVGEQEFAVDTTSNAQLIEINNLLGVVIVTADIKKISYDIEISINNTEYGTVESESGVLTILYGENDSLIFTPLVGYYVKTVLYNNQNVTGQLVNGVMQLNNVKGVCQISVIFERIVYSVTVGVSANGSVYLPKTQVSLGENILVSILASAGYAIDYYTINGIQGEPLAENQTFGCFDLLVEEDIVLSVYYKEYAGGAEQTVYVQVSGQGYIQGNITNYDDGAKKYTLAVTDSIDIAVMADTGYYIKSIDGVLYGTKTAKWVSAEFLAGSTIDIVFDKEDYEVAVNSPDNGSVQVDKSIVAFGDSVEFTFISDEGYELAYLKINGFIVTSSGSSYTISAANEDINAVARFKLKTYTIAISASANGSITTPLPYFEYGSTVAITVIPNVGFSLASLTLGASQGSYALNPAEIDAINAASRLNKVYIVSATVARDLAIAEGELKIQPVFVSNVYTVNVSIEGSGNVVNHSVLTGISATHGASFNLELKAADSNYLSNILVNGQPIDLLDHISNAKINPITNELIEGDYTIDVRQNYNIHIVFLEDHFRVAVVSSSNGVTTIGDGLEQMDVKTGANVQLSMRANEGYHIANVRINGINVSNTDKDMFPFDDVNHNSTNFYMLADIRQNISIQVTYERNTYVASIVTVNKSINFYNSDDISEKYGTVIISGYESQPGVDGAVDFSGIPHGNPFNIIITPVRNKGYQISKFVIEWKPTTSSDFQEITPVFDPKGYVYRFENITNDINKIYVEFERELFTLTERVSSDEGEVHTLFYNPISGASIDNIDSVLDNSTGMRTYTGIEYGIQTITNVQAPVGFTLTSFIVNNFERLSYVRNDRYSTFIQNDSNIIVEYTRNQYSFALNDISASGSITKGWISVNKEGETQDNVLTVVHGTTLQLVITPNYNVAGYAINSVEINGVKLSISNKNAEYIHNIVVVEHTVVDVIFSINLYNIFITQPLGGGRVTIPNMAANASATIPAGNVEWGNNVKLTFEIANGYRLDEFTVNGVDCMSVDIENGSIYTISNIKEVQHISIKYVRKTYTISFDGNFDDDNTYMENGTRIEPYATFNGTVVSNSQFTDQIILHFKLAIGYQMQFSVTMGGVLQPFDADKLAVDANNSYWYTYTINSLAGNLEIEANYTIKEYGITVSANDNTNMEYSITNEAGNDALSANHFDNIIVSINVAYGYSLNAFYVNNVEYSVGEDEDYCAITYNNSNNVYSYAITLRAIDELIGAFEDEMFIIISIAKNTYYVQIVPVDSDGEPTNKLTFTGDRSYGHGDSVVIQQILAEGYSITNITINGLALNEYGNEIATAISYTAGVVNLTLTGNLVSKLDMHGAEFGSNAILVFRYTVEIDIHSTTIKQYIIETGRNPDTQVEVAGTTTAVFVAFNQSESSFTTINQNYTEKEYFTICTFTSSVHQGIPYRFAGYQEYRGGTWQYVVNGQNGIIIKNNNTIEYTIKADRIFRAVYYRQYEAIVEVASQYKYIDGQYIVVDGQYTNSLQFKEYAEITATSNGVAVSDSEHNLTHQYKFIIDCNAYMKLSYEDFRPQNATVGISYLEETIIGGVKQYSSVSNDGSGILITKDIKLFAAMHNEVRFTIMQETVGAEATNGGEPQYSVMSRGTSAYNTASLSGNHIKVEAFDTVKITVPVNDNYRFHGLFKLLVDEEASRSQERLIFSGQWSLVSETQDGLITKYTQGGQDVYEIRVTDNSIYKLQYFKTLDVSIMVDYKEENGSVLPTVTNAEDSLVGNAADFYHNGRYDYGSVFSVIVNSGLDLQVLGEKYQFIGWHICYNYNENGSDNEWENLDPTLEYVYPRATNRTFRLAQYDEQTSRDGFQLNNKFEIAFKAMYIPIYKVTLINEYNYTASSNQLFEFDAGHLILKNILYNTSRYNGMVQNTICSSGDELNLLIMGSYQDPEDYNKWENTKLDLSVALKLTFKLVHWQYSYDGISYENFEGGNESEYSTLLESDIYIKPIFQKRVTVVITPMVFYEGFGVSTNNPEYINLQNPFISILGIDEDGNEKMFEYKNPGSLTFEFDFDAEITLHPKDNLDEDDPEVSGDPGYDVVGWFKHSTNENAVIPDYEGETVTMCLNTTEQGSTVDTYYLQCRYIKVWSIIVKIYNDSDEDIADNVPKATFDGEDMRTASNPNKESVERRVWANTALYLLVNTTGEDNHTDYSPQHDKLYKVTNLEGRDTFNPSPNVLAGYLYAKGNRTVEIIYRTYCTFTITDVMPGSVFMFTPNPDSRVNSISKIIGTSVVEDGVYPDTTGVDGKIKLEGLYVIGQQNDVNSGNSVYESTYGIVLKNMSLEDYQCLSSGMRNIDFKLGGSYQKDYTMSCYELTGYTQPFDAGNGDEGSPYLISSRSHLANVEKYYNAMAVKDGVLSGVYFKLTNNISLNNWNPICDIGENGGKQGFNGILDGGGWELNNFSFTGDTSKDNIGIFICTYQATIKNLIVKSSGTMLDLKNRSNVGVLAGEANGTTFLNITIENVYLGAKSHAGIMAGQCKENTTFSDCVVNNSTIADYGAGCFGAFAGVLESSTINNCGASGITIVSSSSELGGFVGKMIGTAQISNSILEGNNTLGSNNAKMVGGFVGSLGESIADQTSKIENCTISVIKLEIIGKYHNDSYYNDTGGGGFAGRNFGLIKGCKIESGNVIIKASVGGGIAGVNDTGGRLENNILQNGLVDFHFHTVSTYEARLGGHAGVNIGTISGSKNSKAKGANDWDIYTAMVVFRMSNIDFSGNNKNNVEYTWKNTYMGGISGYNTGIITNCENSSKIIHARKIGDNIGPSMWMGGIVGYTSGGTVTYNLMSGIMRSFNFIDADQGILKSRYDDPDLGEGEYKREYNYMGGVIGEKSGGTVSGNSANGHTVYFLAIKYSDVYAPRVVAGVAWGSSYYSYNRSECTITARAITGTGGIPGDGTIIPPGGSGSVSADSEKTGSRTNGAWDFVNNTSNSIA